MGFTLAASLVLLIPLLAQNSTGPDDWRAWLNKGVAEFRAAKYDDAVADFQKAVDAKPSEAAPHLYLGTAWMRQYTPAANPPATRSDPEMPRRNSSGCSSWIPATKPL